MHAENYKDVKLWWPIFCPSSTGCNSIFRKIFKFKIWKKPMLVQKQTIHQQKALDLSFNLTSWKWAWHYHEAVTPSRRRTTFFTLRGTMLFAARKRGALLIKPRPLLGSQIKAEIKGFLRMYRLFLYYLWFFQKMENRWKKYFSYSSSFLEIAEIIFFRPLAAKSIVPRRVKKVVLRREGVAASW